MVSNNEGTHLSVIEGMKGKNERAGGCTHHDQAEQAKEPSTSHDPLGTPRYDEVLRQLLTAKLAHEHRKLRADLENQMRELDFSLSLEKITYEASLDGVPVRHIQDSHDAAFEALEAAQNRVA